MAVLLSFLAYVSSASEFAVTPRLRSSVEVYDNRRLRPVDGSGLLAAQARMGLDAEYSRPTSSITVSPEFQIIRNTSQKTLDAENYLVDFSAAKQFERHQFSFDFSFERELSAATELEEVGFIDTAIPRTEFSMSSSLISFVTERLQLISYGGYTDVAYSDSQNTVLNDYSNASVGLNLDYAASARTSLLVRTGASIFETPSFGNKTTAYRLQLGIRHALDETLDVQFIIGQNISQAKSTSRRQVVVSLVPLTLADQVVTSTERLGGQILETNIVKRWDKGNLTVQWDRFISPSSLGSRQKRQAVAGQLLHRFDRRWTANAFIRYVEQEQELGSLGTLNVRNRIGSGASVRYRQTEHLALTMTYRHDLLFGSNGTPDAKANRLMLEMSYTGKPIQWLN